MNTKYYVSTIAALVAAAALAVPQSPVVIYGQVRDEYGNNLQNSSALTLKLVNAGDISAFAYAKTTVGETAYPGMNYRLSLEIDSEGPTRSYAVLEGTEMRICFFDDTGELPATPSTIFNVPANGTALRKDFFLGNDGDGDGMPDVWEAWALQMDGKPSDDAAIAAFKPGDDPDGDGMSNLRELLAGTDPFLATDLFEITHFVKTGESDRTEIKFTTSPGRKYRIVMATGLGADAAWVPVAASLTPSGAAEYTTYPGTGRDRLLYIDTPASDSAFFRVAVQ